MNELHWLPLRLNIIPLIDRQCQKVVELFDSLKKEILEGDILAIQKIAEIKIQVSQRLQQIDIFYEQYAMDPRVKYLFGCRTLLAKIISESSQVFHIQDSLHVSVPWKADFSKSSQPNDPLISKISIHQNHSAKSRFQNPLQNSLPHKLQDSFNYALEPQPIRNSKIQIKHSNVYPNQPQDRLKVAKLNQKNVRPIKILQEEEVESKKLYLHSANEVSKQSHSPLNQRKTGKKMEHLLNTKTKIDRDRISRREEEEESRKILEVEHAKLEVKKSYKDLSELVFTIKMTKEEYQDFMRLKQRNHHA